MFKVPCNHVVIPYVRIRCSAAVLKSAEPHLDLSLPLRTAGTRMTSVYPPKDPYSRQVMHAEHVEYSRERGAVPSVVILITKPLVSSRLESLLKMTRRLGLASDTRSDTISSITMATAFAAGTSIGYYHTGSRVRDHKRFAAAIFAMWPALKVINK